MNDIYTLLTIRDEIYEQYQIAKKRNNSRHQWSGLLAALSLVEQKIQAEMDFRDSTAPQDAVLSPDEWENME
jgi:hypothetical protein